MEFQAIPSVIGGEHGELTAVSPKNSPNEKVLPALQKIDLKLSMGQAQYRNLRCQKDDFSIAFVIKA